MIVGVTMLVAIGLALALGLGVSRGFDPVSAVILGFLVLFGALAVAVTRRASHGTAEPGRCARCEGLISPNAPYCKHCGASVEGASATTG